ncbi:MAG: AMP-binding protein [Aeromicrobium sp.]
MTALGFELLDLHVVRGKADALACADESGALTFAQLLDRVASVAGGLSVLGVGIGHPVHIDLPRGNSQVVAVCAVIRLGAIPSAAGDVRIAEVDGAEVVQVRGETVEFAVLERAGRSEPAPALRVDPDGYSEAVGVMFADIVEPLLSGSPVV